MSKSASLSVYFNYKMKNYESQIFILQSHTQRIRKNFFLIHDPPFPLYIIVLSIKHENEYTIFKCFGTTLLGRGKITVLQ